MSKITLAPNASGTGTLTIAAPNTNTDRTLTLPDITGTILTSATTKGFPAGSVLQVVSTAKTDTFSSTTTGSWVDVTGLSATITPTSASSKVYISYNVVVTNSNGWFTYLKLVRDSTDVGIGDAAGNRLRATSMAGLGSAMNDYPYINSNQFLDSPNTTSSTTYKIQLRFGGNTTYVNRTPTDSDTSAYGRSISTITVMEIAA